MKKFKKAAAVILAIIIVIVGCFGIYILYRFNCNKGDSDIPYSDIYAQEQVSLDADAGGYFRILKINDTHFLNGTCETDAETLNEIEAILDKTPCDLIIVDGDLVDGFNLSASYNKYNAISLFAELIESYNIPWTFAPGNNDAEIDGSNEDIIAYMMQYDNFICGNNESVDSSMQFFIDIYYNDELAHTVAIMDSGMRSPKAIGSYESMTESQIDWLNDGIYERSVTASVFFHMPTPAFQESYDNGAEYAGFDMYNTTPYDDIEGNSLFDEMTQDNEYIKLISCAHQHSNNMCSLYNGRYYQLSCVSGYSAGRDDFITPSCTLISINVNSSEATGMYYFEQITG